MSVFDAFEETKIFAQYAINKFKRRSLNSPTLPSKEAVKAYNEAVNFFNTGEYDNALGQIVVAHAVYDENQRMDTLETRIALKQSMESDALRKINNHVSGQ